MPAQIPVYQYTIALTGGETRTVAAISYREYEEWLVFDDTRATVYQVRREKIDEISRSVEAVGQQRVDELGDGGENR